MKLFKEKPFFWNGEIENDNNQQQVACAILERTSGLEPSSETTAPRYYIWASLCENQA